MARHKDINWILNEGISQKDGTTTHSSESIHSALLMDIRDELKRLNSLLYCSNFLQMPHDLRAIRRNTSKKRRRG